MAIVSANGAAAPLSPNYIINGAFDFWQRGTTFNSIGTSVYFADRWGTGAVFSPNVMNITRESFPVGIGSTLDFEYEYFARFTRTISGSAATYFGQKIENVRTLAGKTVTLSYWARVSSGTLTAPRVFLNQQFGFGGSTEVDNLGAVSPTYTTTWTRFKQTVSIPSISGKTLGSGHNLWVLWQLPDSGNFTLDITGVQLEEGSIATPFRRNANSLQGELAACQRYYFRNTGNSYTAHGNGVGANSNQADFMIKLPTAMRVAPTLVDYSNLAIFDGTNIISGITNAIMQPLNVTTDTAYVSVTKSGSVTQFRPYFLINSNSTSGYLGFSAEL